MKRKLLRQTANEWRANLWLVIELMIVSVIVWYIGDYLYVVAATRMEPTGFNAEHLYKAEYKILKDDSSELTEEETKARNAADLRAILHAIAQRDGVEEVGFSRNAAPYAMSFRGNELWNDRDTLKIQVNMRWVSPGHIRATRYQPADPSQSIEDLIARLQPGSILITDFQPGGKNIQIFPNIKTIGAEDIVGRTFHVGRDSVKNVPIVGVLQPVKRSNVESRSSISAFISLDENIDEEMLMADEISIRVRPEAERNFLESFNADRERLYHIGNVYISRINSYEQIRIDADHNEMVMVRKYLAVMIFMLVSVFLGLLGTFWFRTQQRIGEIAIRKVNGATNGSIFMRLIGEGMLLLAIATIPAIVIDWILTHYEFNAYYGNYGYFTIGRFLLTVAITFILMAVMIIAGIWFPARRAMKVEPSVALADE